MKLLAAIITYYPDATPLRRNIEAILGEVDHLVIWENTPAPKHIDCRPDWLASTAVTYLGTGENEFIAKKEIEIKRADFDIFLKEFKQSAMILQSKWLFREAEVDKKSQMNKLEIEVDTTDEKNNFIDRIYAKQMQYHFKSATK